MQRSKMNCRFTLIELLVVVSVIAILLTMLLPALQRAKFQGRKLTCLSNTRQMVSAALQYSSDQDGNFPIGGQYSCVWMIYVSSYLGLGIYEDKIANNNLGSNDYYVSASNSPERHLEVFRCPETITWPRGYYPVGCYAYNVSLTSGTNDRFPEQITRYITPVHRISKPSLFVLLGDGYLQGALNFSLFTKSIQTPEEQGRTVKDRCRNHRRTINFGFVDGHSENLRINMRDDLLMGESHSAKYPGVLPGWTKP